MAGQFLVGKKAKFYRGTDAVPYCLTINPPKAKAAKIKVTNLDSLAQEYISDFLPDYPELVVKFMRDFSDAVQNGIETDFHGGLAATESWKYEARHNSTGALLRTYAFSGYILGCDTGPFSAEDRVEMEVTIQLSGGITIS